MGIDNSDGGFVRSVLTEWSSRVVFVASMLEAAERHMDIVTFFFFFILRRMGKNKALAHHTSTYFHTRRVSI